MSKKVLQVIDDAYRCTVEEQDDPAVWITHAMRGAGAQLGVLLGGAAVNYAVKGQDASGLRFGNRSHQHPPRLERDVDLFSGKDVPVFLVAEDVDERGISRDDLIDSVELIGRGNVAGLFDDYDEVWHW